VIVETTSGTFGLALAMQCALMRRPFVMVSDPVIDAGLRRRLADLGAEMEICEQPAPVGGFQQARLHRLAEVMAAQPDSFCPRQYSNPDNPASYSIVADHLRANLGSIGCLVGPVGSGGSMCGTVSRLRETGPGIQAIGVDTQQSVLFGARHGPRELRGLGNSLLPANLDHRIFDEVHWINAAEAYASTRQLHREHALFHGPTSGAAYRVGRWWAERHPGQRCVVMLPDEGYRYLETVYDDDWIAGRDHLPPAMVPARVRHPLLAGPSWSYYPWARQSLQQVLARQPLRDLAGSHHAGEIAS
jgi:cysteine synthase